MVNNSLFVRKLGKCSLKGALSQHVNGITVYLLSRVSDEVNGHVGAKLKPSQTFFRYVRVLRVPLTFSNAKLVEECSVPLATGGLEVGSDSYFVKNSHVRVSRFGLETSFCCTKTTGTCV